jgi:cyclohexanone monooxygenase
VTSIMFMHEAQAHYIVRALRSMTRGRQAVLEVRERRTERYNRRIQAAMDGTVWTAGCSNYFQTATGKVVTQLPYSAGRYWLRTRIFDRWNYRFSRARTQPPSL